MARAPTSVSAVNFTTFATYAELTLRPRLERRREVFHEASRVLEALDLRKMPRHRKNLETPHASQPRPEPRVVHEGAPGVDAQRTLVFRERCGLLRGRRPCELLRVVEGARHELGGRNLV